MRKELAKDLKLSLKNLWSTEEVFGDILFFFLLATHFGVFLVCIIPPNHAIDNQVTFVYVTISLADLIDKNILLHIFLPFCSLKLAAHTASYLPNGEDENKNITGELQD